MAEWKTQAPCLGCEKRKLGCREECDAWQAYQRDLAEEKKQKREFNEVDRLCRSYHHNRWAKADKQRQMRRK